MDNEGLDFDRTGTSVEQRDAHELARLADELVGQITAARQHYVNLRAAIEDSAEGTAQAVAVAPAPPVQAHTETYDEVDEPVDDRGYQRTPEEEAEIVALGMALNGGNRDEAHMHIVETFGIYDTDEILDRTFGAHYVHPTPEPPRRFGRRRRG